MAVMRFDPHNLTPKERLVIGIACTNDELRKSITIPGEGTTLQFAEQELVLTEAALERMALLRFLNLKPIIGSPFEFRRRDALPSAMPEGSGAIAQTTGDNSDYAKPTVPLKIVRSYGMIDEFVEATDYGFDVAASEILGVGQAVGYEATGMTMWGDLSGNPYQCDGMEMHPNLIRIDGGANTLTLAELDDLIDQTGASGDGISDEKLLLMSRQMQSAVKRAMTAATGDGTVVNLDEVSGTWPDADGGWRLKSYEGVPILPIALTRPRGAAPTITGAE